MHDFRPQSGLAGLAVPGTGARPSAGKERGPGTGVQARHAPAVLANRLVIAESWGKPCLGYLLFLQPDPAAAAAFRAVQDDVLALEPSLLRQPEGAMHSSVALVVPVFGDFDQPKDEIWREHGAGWVKIIAGATAAMADGHVRLCFRRLVVTDAAIIAVADEPNPIGELRRAVTSALQLPWPVSRGDLVHLTLFRYRAPLADPARLLAMAASRRLAVETSVSEVLLVRETTFPAMDFEVLHRLPLGPRMPPSASSS